MRDIAALPTSWGLTIWDALPVFLSVELAVAIVIVLLGTGSARTRYWRLTDGLILGALAYTALFHLELMLAFAAVAVIHLTAHQVLKPETSGAIAPSDPRGAIADRFPDVAWSVAKGAAAAAIVKILIAPLIGLESGLWFAVALIGGLLAPLSLGAAAIPAVSIESAAGIVPALVWLMAAAIRPYIAGRLLHANSNRVTSPDREIPLSG